MGRKRERWVRGRRSERDLGVEETRILSGEKDLIWVERGFVGRRIESLILSS